MYQAGSASIVQEPDTQIVTTWHTEPVMTLGYAVATVAELPRRAERGAQSAAAATFQEGVRTFFGQL